MLPAFKCVLRGKRLFLFMWEHYWPYIFIRGNESNRKNPPRKRRPLFVNYCDGSTPISSEIIEYFTPLSPMNFYLYENIEKYLFLYLV